jgi:Mg-chelatase subunit ChlD
MLTCWIPAAWTQTQAPNFGSPATSNGNPAGQAAPAPVQPGDAQQAPSEQQPSAEPGTGDQGMFVFKKQVEEVVLHATVVDDQQHLVTGLDQNAFAIYENGAPQAITSFRREDVPVEIGVVIDNSGSMRDKRSQVNQAVLNLVRASNTEDKIFVVNFGQNPYLDQDFTSDAKLLEAALHQVSAKGSTALYDAIIASAVHLENNQSLNKKVLLVIRLLGGGLQAEGRDALQHLAASTGGVAYFPDSLNEVDSLTRTVARDIRSQYTIAFKPKNQNVKPEYQSLRVEAHAPGYQKLNVRTRSGYYPPAAGQ